MKRVVWIALGLLVSSLMGVGSIVVKTNASTTSGLDLSRQNLAVADPATLVLARGGCGGGAAGSGSCDGMEAAGYSTGGAVGTGTFGPADKSGQNPDSQNRHRLHGKTKQQDRAREKGRIPQNQ